MNGFREGHPGIAHQRLFEIVLSAGSPERRLEQQFPVRLWESTSYTRSLGRRTRVEPSLNIPFIDSKPASELALPHKPTVIIFPGVFSSIEAARIDAAAIDAIGMRTIVVDYASNRNLERFIKDFPDFLRDQHVDGDIILYGTSLGGILAQYMSLYSDIADRVIGMVLSHTAHPTSKKNFSHGLTQLAGVLQIAEKPLQWEVVKEVVSRVSNRRGIRQFTPGEDLGPLDKGIAHMMIAQSDVDYNTLDRERARGFVDFLLNTTRGTRWPQKPFEQKTSSIPTLWIHTEGDSIMKTESQEKLQQLYPQITIVSFPSTYNHHNHAFRRGTMLVDHITPFLENVAL